MTVDIVTLTTNLSTHDHDRTHMLRNASDRATDLATYGQRGYRLISTVTVPAPEVVTVIDTLAKEVAR